ncbi:MAG: iron-containing redox enzyme family protein [Pseudonocardia sp.]
MGEFDRAAFERRAAELMEEQFARVPRMREFHAGTWTDREYYVRHLVETLLRIRLNNVVDSYALYRAATRNDPLAPALVRYLAEEWGHEHMFMRDLRRFGLTEAQVDAMSVLRSTEYLMGFLRLAVDQEGPAPTSIWNFLVEWYSDRYNGVITAHAAATYGAEMVRGSHAHLDIDDTHDHADMMWRTVQEAVAAWSGSDAALRHLETFVRLIGDYFQELHDTTTGRRAEVQLSAE